MQCQDLRERVRQTDTNYTLFFIHVWDRSIPHASHRLARCFSTTILRPPARRLPAICHATYPYPAVVSCSLSIFPLCIKYPPCDEDPDEDPKSPIRQPHLIVCSMRTTNFYYIKDQLTYHKFSSPAASDITLSSAG